MMVKRRGPRIDPCGTPKLTDAMEDSYLEMEVNCCLSVKYDVNKEKAEPVTRVEREALTHD